MSSERKLKVFLCHSSGDKPAVRELYKRLHEFAAVEADRMAVLMDKYQDTPMDLADASLVAVAESLTVRRIFTIDKDFYIYRLSNGSAFDIIH